MKAPADTVVSTKMMFVPLFVWWSSLQSSWGFSPQSAQQYSAGIHGRTIQQQRRVLLLPRYMAVNVSEPASASTSPISPSEEAASKSQRMAPRPPDYPPPLSSLKGDSMTLQEEYDGLRFLADESANKVERLELKIEDLQQQLKTKTSELDGSSDAWSLEKTSLLAKIAEITSSFTKQKQEFEDVQYDRERLQREVVLLQEQIEAAMNALRAEQDGAGEIRARLSDVEDALEFQQMQFEKEKTTLEATLQQERQRLEEIVKDWESDKDRFLKERAKIESQLEEERQALEKAETTRSQNQRDFEAQESALRAELAKQTAVLKQRTEELTSERADYQKDRTELRRKVEEEREKVISVNNILAEERTRFSTVQADLEELIKSEQTKVASLSARLEEETARFESEKTRLETRIEQEQERLREVESRLAEERIVFAETEKDLQYQLAEEIRVRKLKKRLMNDRFSAIRKEMTALWEGAKRDARKEKTALAAKYAKEMDAMKASMRTLEGEVDAAKEAALRAEAIAKDMEAARDRALSERDSLEARYMGVVAQRNQEIASLQSNLQALRITVNEKDALLSQYQSSYRQLFKLTLKLTGKRIARPFRGIAGWIRNRKYTDL
jgi:chromosome segregation ATPase